MPDKSAMVDHRKMRSLAFGGLIALAAAMGIGRFVLTPILPYMIEDLDLSKGHAGLIASANFLGYLVGALIAVLPRFANRKRLCFFAGLALSALTTGAMGFYADLNSFLLFRFLGGIASAFVLVFASALVLERLSAAGAPKLSALHFAGVGVGIAISALLVAGVGSLGYSWRAQWITSGLVSLLALGAVAWLVPGEYEAPHTQNPDDNGQNKGRLTGTIIAYGLFGFGYVITATFITTIVREEAALRSLEVAVWLVVGLTAAPSVAFWTWVGARIGIAHAFSLACLIEAIGVAFSVLSTNSIIILISAAFLGGTIMGITALGLMQARRLAKAAPHRAMALMTASFALGQMIGPSFAGFLHDILDSFITASLAASAALVVAALLVQFRK